MIGSGSLRLLIILLNCNTFVCYIIYRANGEKKRILT